MSVVINEKIAELIMGESRPFAITRQDLSNQDDPLAREYLPFTHSDKRNWRVVEYYDEGDEPRWEALNFSENVDLALSAVDFHFGEEQNITLFRQNSGHWQATGADRYGFGSTIPEAICSLLLEDVEAL